MNKDKTLVILKPHSVQLGLCGDIISRFEKKGIKILAIKMIKMSRELAENHYIEHKGKEFYPTLIDYMVSYPVMVMLLYFEHDIYDLDAATIVMDLVGSPKSYEGAPPGTIRGDYGFTRVRNVIHCSQSAEQAAREIPLFFSNEEILENY